MAEVYTNNAQAPRVSKREGRESLALKQNTGAQIFLIPHTEAFDKNVNTLNMCWERIKRPRLQIQL